MQLAVVGPVTLPTVPAGHRHEVYATVLLRSVVDGDGHAAHAEAPASVMVRSYGMAMVQLQ